VSVAGLVRATRDSRTALPLDLRVAGLSLLLRAVLVMRKLGFSPLRVVVDEEDEPLARNILAKRRLDSIEIVRTHTIDEPTVVLPYDVICDEKLLQALRDSDGDMLVCRDGVPLGLGRMGGRETKERLEIGDAFLVRITSSDAVTRATRALFEACRKPVDGIVSRNFNRHVSLFVSKRIVDTKITPNAVSVTTLFIGLLASACVVRGGYGWTLVAATLLQCNSILDGVDGELARVRHEQSHLGQWLDTLSDDIVNIVFWAALGYGASRLPHGRWLMQAGVIASVANLVFACVYWIELVALGSGDTYAIDWAFKRTPPRGVLGRILLALAYVPKKDFFIFFCFVCAVLGILPLMLPVIALAAVCSLGAALVRGASRLVSARAW